MLGLLNYMGCMLAMMFDVRALWYGTVVVVAVPLPSITNYVYYICVLFVYLRRANLFSWV